MTRRDQRWVGRVSCQIDARILSRQGWVTAQVRDLSRTGVGLALRPEVIGIDRSVDMGRFAWELGRLLPEHINGEFSPDRLGQLVTRKLTIVRLRRWDRDAVDLVLGCTFDRELNDEESVALGLALPERGESVTQAHLRLLDSPARSDAPRPA